MAWSPKRKLLNVCELFLFVSQSQPRALGVPGSLSGKADSSVPRKQSVKP